ncbi:MAG TPA: sulfatase-like hydrolase/transferase [Vicinamibacterales bacterium]|nr:sulfatase-like hydrolase/transferase [Vicinamibacterales bacterium]
MPRPFRYTFILALVALATGLAAAGGWRYARASAPVSGPIIVVSIDTLRADHLPAYGYRKVKTPAIDALAADGVVFERAYSHAPQTLPAHAALLSGRLPFETGVRDNVGFTVRPGERMLPQMLRERGFATGGVVSAYVLRKETGINQGFDFFDDDMPAASHELTIGQLQRNGADSEAIAERWLDTVGTSRAFLFLHLYEPHKPYWPPERFSQYAPYDGEIAYSDEIVGKLIRYLKSHQLYDRSTIVLLSDHGEGLGDHGEQEHGLFVYEEAIHVPLIIKQEGNEGAGRRVGDLVQHIDLVPTMLKLVKAPAPGNLRGRSLKPLLDGSGHLDAAPVYSEALYARYHFGWSELTALTDDRYRYIKAPREELYDLEGDPRERVNIAEDRPQPRQAMRGALDRVAAGATIQGQSQVSADTRERLQALGYVGASSDVSTTRGDALPDPKDKREILEKYRAATDLAAERKWSQSIILLQQILREEPEMADLWTQLANTATRVDRYDLVVDAYKHHIELQPNDSTAYVGAAAAFLKLRKFTEARANAALGAQVAADGRSRGGAHEMLSRIGLAQHDLAFAREHARLAQESDSTLPMPLFVEARILYDEGKYAEALPLFQQAADELKHSGSLQMGELHFYVADTLGRLVRYREAEAEFLQELKYYPFNSRARAGLAMLYQASERPDEADRVIADMMRTIPTPETYALAARLWTMFGNRRQAEAVRAEGRRAFADHAPASATAARR